MTYQEERFRFQHAMRVLGGGIGIWDRFKDGLSANIRRIALREKARALVESDRLLTGIDPARLRGSR